MRANESLLGPLGIRSQQDIELQGSGVRWRGNAHGSQRGEGAGMTGINSRLQCGSDTGETGGGERTGLRLKLSCDEEPRMPWPTQGWELERTLSSGVLCSKLSFVRSMHQAFIPLYCSDTSCRLSQEGSDLEQRIHLQLWPWRSWSLWSCNPEQGTLSFHERASERQNSMSVTGSNWIGEWHDLLSF